MRVCVRERGKREREREEEGEMGSSLSCFGGGEGSAKESAVMRETTRRRDGRIFASSFAHSRASSVVAKMNRRKRAAQARAQNSRARETDPVEIRADAVEEKRIG